MLFSLHLPLTILIRWKTLRRRLHINFSWRRRVIHFLHIIQWIAEVRHYCPAPVPIILVGCKADLCGTTTRDDLHLNREQAELVARQIGAHTYQECSVFRNEGVSELFEAATRASLSAREPKGSWRCCVVVWYDLEKREGRYLDFLVVMCNRHLQLSSWETNVGPGSIITVKISYRYQVKGLVIST